MGNQHRLLGRRDVDHQHRIFAEDRDPGTQAANSLGVEPQTETQLPRQRVLLELLQSRYEEGLAVGEEELLTIRGQRARRSSQQPLRQFLVAPHQHQAAASRE